VRAGAPTGEAPRVESLADARLWIAILHRRTVQDAEQINALAAWVAALRAPWWRRGRALRRARRLVDAVRGCGS
jgi:hypothetical protein